MARPPFGGVTRPLAGSPDAGFGAEGPAVWGLPLFLRLLSVAVGNKAPNRDTLFRVYPPHLSEEKKF